MSIPPALAQAIDRLHSAIGCAARGDPGPIQALYSHAADVTAFYGWGGYERGWDAVRKRWNWAARQFAGGVVSYETLTTVATAEMAYTTDLETFRVRLASVKPPVEWSNRVTHVFRLEDGEWRLIHRHANRLESRSRAAERVPRRRRINRRRRRPPRRTTGTRPARDGGTRARRR